MHIAQRALDAEPFHALAFGQRAAALEAAGHHVVKLSIGEPDFGAPPAVREAMRDAMDGRPLPYTAALGLPALRDALSRFYREKHGVAVDPARIAITSGASAALLLVTAATTDPGDEVLLADPSYPCNRELVRSFGGRPVLVPTSAASRYQLDVDAVAGAWSDRTTAVMIASPSNPTGTSIPPAELAAICDLARDRGAWRIVDEIYLDLADPAADGTPAQTVLAHDPDAVVIGSFSKYFGMTGWRLGWAVLPEALVPVVERLAMNYFLCASAPAQLAALAAFTPESLAICEERRLELAAAPRDRARRARRHRPARPGRTGRRVLRLHRRERHGDGCLAVLRGGAAARAGLPHTGTRLRPRHRGHPRAAVLRRVPRRPVGRHRAARRVPRRTRRLRASGGTASPPEFAVQMRLLCHAARDVR